MTGASLAVSVIGKSLAQARGLLTKHAVKQVDRLLSNPGILVWDCFAYWVPEVVGRARRSWWRWTGPISTGMGRPPWC